MAAPKEHKKDKKIRQAKGNLSSSSVMASQKNVAENNMLRHRLNGLDQQRRRSIQAISNEEKSVLKELQQGLPVHSDILRLPLTFNGHKQHLDLRRASVTSNLPRQRDRVTETKLYSFLWKDSNVQVSYSSQNCLKLPPTQLSSSACDDDESSMMANRLNAGTQRKGSLQKSFSMEDKHGFSSKVIFLDLDKHNNSSNGSNAHYKPRKSVQIPELTFPIRTSVRDVSKFEIKQTQKKNTNEKYLPSDSFLEDKYRQGEAYRTKNLESLDTTSSQQRLYCKRGSVVELKQVPAAEIEQLKLQKTKKELKMTLGREENRPLSKPIGAHTVKKGGKKRLTFIDEESANPNNGDMTGNQTMFKRTNLNLRRKSSVCKTETSNKPYVSDNASPPNTRETSMIPCGQRRASLPTADRVLCKLIGEPHADDTKAQWDNLSVYFEELRRKCQLSSPALSTDQQVSPKDEKSPFEVMEQQNQSYPARRSNSEGSVVMLANVTRSGHEVDPYSDRIARHKLSTVPFDHPCFGLDNDEKNTTVKKLATMHSILQNSALSMAESETET